MNTEQRDIENDWIFWKEIVLNEDGSINIEQLKKELSDFRMVMNTASKVYMHITDGMISKVNIMAEAIISEADACYEKSNIGCMTEYFFSQDGDSHWYKIPVEKAERWKELINADDGENEDVFDAINTEFGDYRTGGGISDITFFCED